MSETPLVAHLVGSIPLPDADTVFRRLSSALGPHLKRIPDGETGIRKSWIKFLQDVLAANPAIEVASDVPPFKFTQWDGKVIREIPRLRVRPGKTPESETFDTGYARAAIDAWAAFERLQLQGVIPARVKFQVCLPSPLAPLLNNMMPADRPKLLPAFTRHLVDEIARIAAALPAEQIALQWDVCQEVLAWEGYYEAGAQDIRRETLDSLVEIGDAVPAAMELGYHLCYGSPADEHLVQPRDMAIMVEMTNELVARVGRQIDFMHMPVPKSRTDDGYFQPLDGLTLDPATELYLGLIHHGDDAGNQTRLAVARRHAKIHGIAAECGLGRADPARLESALAAHARLIEALG